MDELEAKNNGPVHTYIKSIFVCSKKGSAMIQKNVMKTISLDFSLSTIFGMVFVKRVSFAFLFTRVSKFFLININDKLFPSI